jgi:hypothetical protein
MHHASFCDAAVSASRMVFPLGVSLKLLAVEVDLAQFAGAVALGLIVEVRGRGMAALAAGRHGPGAHVFAEFNQGDETVAARFGRGENNSGLGACGVCRVRTSTSVMYARKQTCASLPAFACKVLLSFRSCSCTR